MAQKFTVPITVKQLSSAGSDAITLYVDTETYSRLKIEAGGRLTWGSGSANGDVNLYRDGADVLRTDDTFKTPTLFVDNIEIDTTGAQTDYILKFDGTKFTAASVTFGGGLEVTTLDSLTDVTISSSTPGDFLKWNGTAWVNDPIDLGTDTTGNYMSGVSAGTGISVTHTPGEGSTATIGLNATLDNLSNVTVPTPSTNDVLQYNGSAWVNTAASSVGATNLDGLTDVTVSAPEKYQTLVYDGTDWINEFPTTVSLVNNAEATTLQVGEAVYLFGNVGNHASVKRADNDSDTTSSKTVGLVAEVIPAGSTGPVVTRGYVTGMDLSSGYTAGQVLWLGESGGLTTTKPTAPEHLVFIGVVVRATNNGIIYVATQNGYELDELHNVAASSPNAGDFLKYNGTLWVNDAINLGTDTIGNYLSSITAGTGIAVNFTPGEDAGASVSLSATLDQLTDVSTSGAVANDVLKYNGSSWIAASAGGANVTSSATAPASPNAGDLWLDSANVDLYIYYDNHWVQLTGEEPLVEDLNDLADVDVPSPAVGNFLKYDGTYWTAASIPTINALDDIGDVSVTGATSGQFLKWNGSAWVPDTVIGGATASSGAPSSPTTGQMWFDTDDARTYVYYDGYWVEVGASGMAATVSDSTPSNPIAGQIWYKSDTGGTYIYYNSNWVEVGAVPAITSTQITNALGFTPANAATAATTGKAIAMSIVFGG